MLILRFNYYQPGTSDPNKLLPRQFKQHYNSPVVEDKFRRRNKSNLDHYAQSRTSHPSRGPSSEGGVSLADVLREGAKRKDVVDYNEKTRYVPKSRVLNKLEMYSSQYSQKNAGVFFHPDPEDKKTPQPPKKLPARRASSQVAGEKGPRKQRFNEEIALVGSKNDKQNRQSRKRTEKSRDGDNRSNSSFYKSKIIEVINKMDDTSLERLSKVLRDPVSVTLEPKDAVDAEPAPHQPNESKAELTEENLVKL